MQTSCLLLVRIWPPSFAFLAGLGSASSALRLVGWQDALGLCTSLLLHVGFARSFRLQIASLSSLLNGSKWVCVKIRYGTIGNRFHPLIRHHVPYQMSITWAYHPFSDKPLKITCHQFPQCVQLWEDRLLNYKTIDHIKPSPFWIVNPHEITVIWSQCLSWFLCCDYCPIMAGGGVARLWNSLYWWLYIHTHPTICPINLHKMDIPLPLYFQYGFSILFHIFLNAVILQVNRHHLELWKSAWNHYGSGGFWLISFSTWMITTYNNLSIYIHWYSMCSPMAHEPLSNSLKPPDFGPIAPGSPGQGNYSAANAALDGHARYWKQVLQARSRQGEAVGNFTHRSHSHSLGHGQGCPWKWRYPKYLDVYFKKRKIRQ